MPRYLLVAGVDFGTSFTKVVLRDNNQPGSKAVVVTYPGHADGLLPSQVGISGGKLLPPTYRSTGGTVSYLKMLAAHVAAGNPLSNSPVRVPPTFQSLRGKRPDAEIVRSVLTYYFANVIAATEAFVRSASPWRDFNFDSDSREDFLVYQLAVPTGLLQDSGASERLFRDAFIGGYELRNKVDAGMKEILPETLLSEQAEEVLSRPRAELDARFQWQCLLYPEVAAAVQAVFRSPSARDGLYVTMDVGAGTVDLNAFRRFTGRSAATRALTYYAAIVCPLGVSHISDPHGSVSPQSENSVMAKLRGQLHSLHSKALKYQPNHGELGNRTWDTATHFIFGGGAHHRGYRTAFSEGLNGAGVRKPQVHNLPAPQDIKAPPGVDFGRFAVAYGLSFFRPSLDVVRLPREIRTFHDLYPELCKQAPREYGFKWED